MFMQKFLIILSALIIGFALRSCRTLLLRKIGAFTFLLASALSFYFIFDCWWAGVIGLVVAGLGRTIGFAYFAVKGSARASRSVIPGTHKTVGHPNPQF